MCSNQEEQRMEEVSVRFISLRGNGVNADEFAVSVSPMLQEMGLAKIVTCADTTGEDCDPRIDDCEIHPCKNEDGTYRLVLMNGREDQPEVQLWLMARCAEAGYAVEFAS